LQRREFPTFIPRKRKPQPRGQAEDFLFEGKKKNKDRNGIRKGMVAVAKMDGSHNIITLGLSKEAAGILAPKLQKSGGRLSLR
jgi:hypothetical protein